MSTIRKSSKPLFFDLSDAKPRGRRQSDRMRCLSELKPGDSVTLDHTGYDTPFSVWLAQARMRQGRAYVYERVVPNAELYKVWLPAKAGKRELVAA